MIQSEIPRRCLAGPSLNKNTTFPKLMILNLKTKNLKKEKKKMEVEKEGSNTPEQQELIDWANKLLNLQIQSLKNCSNGAIFCQILDVIYEGKADISKINWVAQGDENYSTLDQILSTFNIARQFDKQKLLQGDEQEVFKQLRWLKMFSA